MGECEFTLGLAWGCPSLFFTLSRYLDILGLLANFFCSTSH